MRRIHGHSSLRMFKDARHNIYCWGRNPQGQKDEDCLDVSSQHYVCPFTFCAARLLRTILLQTLNNILYHLNIIIVIIDFLGNRYPFWLITNYVGIENRGLRWSKMCVWWNGDLVSKRHDFRVQVSARVRCMFNLWWWNVRLQMARNVSVSIKH